MSDTSIMFGHSDLLRKNLMSKITNRLLGALPAALLAFTLTPTANAADEGIEFGVLPHLSTRVLIQQYKPLREYLQDHLGQPVHLTTAPNFKEFFQRTEAGDYDIVLTAPHFVGLGESRGNHTPMLVLYPEIQGLIIAEKNGPMKTIDDLAGKILALPNPKSLVAKKGMDWLASQGLNPGDNFEILSSANQNSVGDAIMHGYSIAAMLSNGEFKRIPEDVRKNIKIFTVFTEIPGFTFMANPNLDDAKTKKISELIKQFAANSPNSAEFFDAINFKGLRDVTEKDLKVLHSFDELTTKLLGLN
jgi:phosphonate transport system substrate-binding protein